MNGFLVLVQLEDGADDPLAVEPEDEAGGGELGLVAQLAPGQAPQRLLETWTRLSLPAFAYVFTIPCCANLQSKMEIETFCPFQPFHTFRTLARDLTLELNYLQLFSVLAILFEPIWLGISRSTKNWNFKK